MHCPRCGQQQVSAETKFCSRCGMPLGLVSELIVHGGFLPQLATFEKKGKLPNRKMGVKIGLVWFLILTILLTPLFGILDVEELAGFCAVLGTVGGLLIMLLSVMFLEKENKPLFQQQMTAGDNYAQQQFFAGQQRQTALPPQQSQPVESYIPPIEKWRAPNTGELARPGSVIENTTKLLNKDE